MPENKENFYRVSLRFMGDGLPINEIESKLNIKAEHITLKGQTLDDEKIQTHVWCSEYLTKSDVPLEQQLELWLEKLEPQKSELLEILSLPNVNGEFFLGFGSTNNQGGAFFTPKFLKRISDLNLAISFDLYAF